MPTLRSFTALMFLCVLAVSGCARDGAPKQALKPATEYFQIRVGGKVVRMQLAVHPVEQQRGLMERRDLGPDDGMLFVYAAPQQMSFWMRNTPTPLDIGYFDGDGILREVYPLQPFDERAVSSRSRAIKFPLEMKQGWFSANGVRPGAKLDLKAVAAALRARGFEPGRFGLEE